ncbi:tRNA pseudouridine synthase B [Anaerocolumna cellulosilytica]|uniref:tRNA pseudouridine synthase B n=1 Tax=Anaerocolumna cellulosilytica TaxID=433286 RepID=A0A6S6R6Y0_9FIRM|nr:tRNA pseudouridine(55) synthase TruB [Anaerocolumna cellulosilytica]MBB5198041.1 tRNA pseudouridine55 synthase [Anaerocolumna cellulosilytica]BCJ95182.1 tRNA pseudouridine synthase B [Anaerocolumna cellulosilytica]
MINGIINVYKEKGFTSHDVVAKLRGILKQKKIGHTGTLDPDAEGVLPVCLGNGTKLCDMLTDKDKTYEAVLLLGVTTDTQDITGKVLETSKVTVVREEIESAIMSFVGDYEQLPPMYSAIKVGGKRLYELARAGKEVERETRKVRIHNIRILEFDDENHEIRIAVHCSKGTYIRTLCHDIGIKLTCGGCMKELLRTKAGQFTIDDSITLQKIQDLQEKELLSDYIVMVDQMFLDYKKVVIAKEYTKYLYNGNSFDIKHLMEGAEYPVVDTIETSSYVRVYDWQHQFTGIYEYVGKGVFKPVKMFL